MTKRKRRIVGKGDLCRLLGWSRPRLDRRLDQDRRFPVKTRGTAAGGWKFDVEKVRGYLGTDAVPEEKPEVASPPAVNPIVVPRVSSRASSADIGAPGVLHAGEATARQRRDAAQAAMLEDKLRRERGDLVEKTDVEMVLGTTVAHFGKGLDGLPDMIVKKLGLQEERADDLRTLTDDLRTTMVGDLRTMLD